MRVFCSTKNEICKMGFLLSIISHTPSLWSAHGAVDGESCVLFASNNQWSHQFDIRNSKIPWYRESNSQKGKMHLIYSFWVQRILITLGSWQNAMFCSDEFIHLIDAIFSLTVNVSAHHREHWTHNNEQITYHMEFLNISNMFNVNSPDKTLQIWSDWEKAELEF
jgi:hypothetical protein